MIVIGAGPGGEHCADRLNEGGKKVAIVERELVGGEGDFWACMPSKTLLRPGEALAAAQDAPGAAQAVTGDLDPQSRVRLARLHGQGVRRPAPPTGWGRTASSCCGAPAGW